MNEITNYLIGLAKAYAPSLVLALLTLLIGFWIIGMLMRIVNKVLKKQFDKEVQGLLSSMISIAAKIALLISVASIVGIRTTSFIALLGALGLTVGLALQGSLSNFAGGILIIIFKPFKIGDYVEVKGHAGYVKEIQLLHTVMDTLEFKQVVVPNGLIATNQLLNHFAEFERRVEVIMKVHDGEDIDKVKEVIFKVIEQEDLILKERMKDTLVGIKELTDYSIVFSARVWCKSENYWDTYYKIHEAFKKGLADAGIRGPIPQANFNVQQN